MQGRFTDRIEMFLGVGLLLVAILGFMLLILTNLPKSDEVTANRADILRQMPEDIFSSNNPINQQINNLQVPTGVPVGIDEALIGRTNVFESF